MSLDEEYARMVVEAQERSGTSTAYRPSMATWTQEAAMLAVVADKLTALTQNFVAANGGKPGAFVAYPRPKTAIDKVREERRLAQHNRLTRMLLPHLHTEE